jgi:hypothetical protein
MRKQKRGSTLPELPLAVYSENGRKPSVHSLGKLKDGMLKQVVHILTVRLVVRACLI